MTARRWLFAVAATALGAGGCGLPGEGDLQEIDDADLAGLDLASTSTTSTSIAATTTLGSAPIETTTTIATEQVALFFRSGSQLVSVSQTLPLGAGLQQVLLNLEAGPPSGELGVGLESLLPPGLTNRVTELGGVAAVDLSAEVFADIADADQRAAIGQIVLTLTERPGVGQVTFTLDDEPLQVPKRGGELSQPGEAVSDIDYETLVEQGDLPPAAPPETAPPESSPTATTVTG